jgi:acyl carrier protein
MERARKEKRKEWFLGRVWAAPPVSARRLIFGPKKGEDRQKMETALSIEDARRLMRSVAAAKVEGRDLSASTRFADLGLTSLDLVELLFAVEEHLGMELEPTGDSDPTTLGELLSQTNEMAARAAAEASPPMSGGRSGSRVQVSDRSRVRSAPDHQAYPRSAP